MESNKILETRSIVAAIILEARKKKKLSQTELGNLAGVSQSTIRRIEKSVFSPNSDQLYAIMLALDLPIKIGVNRVI